MFHTLGRHGPPALGFWERFLIVIRDHEINTLPRGHLSIEGNRDLHLALELQAALG